MIRIDMHVHSFYSDGTCSVEEIVRVARKKRIALLSLTDHDTLEGIPELLSQCRKYAVSPLPGIELSSEYHVTVHILGYRMKRLDRVEDALKRVLEYRNDRNRSIIEKFKTLGLDIDMSDVEEEARGRVIARPHFARVLVRKGYVPDGASAFSKFLGKGAPAYVSCRGYSPAECVRIIKEADGLPVLAHPSLTRLDRKDLVALLSGLKSHGLWGMECLSSHCTAEESLGFLKLASELSLCPTAGSDFHGANRPGATLGIQVGEDFLPWARLDVML